MVEAALRRGGAGSLLFVTDPAETNRLQRLAIEGNRLGIPLLFGFDVIHGLRTILPVPIAMAASWDPGDDRARPGGRRAGGACRRASTGRSRRWSTSPATRAGAGSSRAPARTRTSVRPSRSRRCAASRVSELGAPERVIAGPKHFAGYGAALGGRDYDEVNLSDSELWNVYLPPFRAAVEAGAGNIMTAYMDLNGIPATGNRWLFTEVLRDTWGFDGFVVSDANAVRNLVTHGFAADLTDAAARAVNAGVDMEMAIADPAYAHLPEALEPGAASEATLDASVRRVLEAKLRMGLFDAPYVDEDRAREVLGRPGAPRGGPGRRRAVGGAAAQRGRPAAARRRALGLDRRHRAARRLPARHPRAVGASTSTSTRR